MLTRFVTNIKKNLLNLLAKKCRKILLLSALTSMPRCSRAADEYIAVFGAHSAKI